MKKLKEIFEKIPLTKETFMGCVGGALVILFVDIWFIAAGQFNAISKANDALLKEQSQIKVLSSELAQIRNLKKQDSAQFNNGSVIKIYRSAEIISLIGIISGVANQYDVKINQLKPEKNGITALSSQTGAAYDLIPVKFNLEAISGYHSFGAFIHTLEHTGTIFTVTELKITTLGSDLFKQKFSLVLETFVRK